MIVYIYPKCSTCKDALRFLNEAGINAEIKDITETPPSVEELKTMLQFQEGNIKKLFNTSGILYREMGLSEKLSQMPLEEALELLTSNGMLVKRPFLIAKKFGLLGFNKTQWSKLLGKN